MGNIFESLIERYEPYRVLFLGLDYAGKTTVIIKFYFVYSFNK